MLPLSMSPTEIVKKIDLTTTDWSDVKFSTNCYAYALGLNVAEDVIGNDYYFAYQPGVIGTVTKGYAIKHLNKMDIEDKLFLDLGALMIKYREVSIDEHIDYQFIRNELYRWKIALYLCKNKEGELISCGRRCFDFHFTRQFPNGSWYGKQGYDDLPKQIVKNQHYYEDIKHLDAMKNFDYYFYKSYELTLSLKR